jgi:hypothetical protein
MIFDGGCPRFAKLTWVFSHRAVIPGEMIFDGAKSRDPLFLVNARSLVPGRPGTTVGVEPRPYSIRPCR